MKIAIKILCLSILFTACNSSKDIGYRKLITQKGILLEFPNSKIMIFDSVYLKSLDETKKFFNPSISTVLSVNKKIQKNYYQYQKRNDLYNLIDLKSDEISRNEYKEHLKLARYTQKHFRFLDKQYVAFTDSLGRRRIIVNVLQANEKKSSLDLTDYFIGFYDVKINAENCSFVSYYE